MRPGSPRDQAQLQGAALVAFTSSSAVSRSRPPTPLASSPAGSNRYRRCSVYDPLEPRPRRLVEPRRHPRRPDGQRLTRRPGCPALRQHPLHRIELRILPGPAAHHPPRRPLPRARRPRPPDDPPREHHDQQREHRVPRRPPTAKLPALRPAIHRPPQQIAQPLPRRRETLAPRRTTTAASYPRPPSGRPPTRASRRARGAPARRRRARGRCTRPSRTRRVARGDARGARGASVVAAAKYSQWPRCVRPQEIGEHGGPWRRRRFAEQSSTENAAKCRCTRRDGFARPAAPRRPSSTARRSNSPRSGRQGVPGRRRRAARTSSDPVAELAT